MTSFRRFLCGLASAATAFGLASGPLSAQDAGPQSTAPEAQSPVLVELFLSQSCAMCPPAAALFPEIAARSDVVALSWHVDFWNITSSIHGRWEDPYSQPGFARRQKRYNKNIRKKSSIYTPQIVVAGEHETVGGKKHKIDDLIDATPRTGVTISSSLSRGGMLFEIDESETGGNAYLVTFKKKNRR